MLNYMRAELWRFFRRSAGKALFLTAALLPALLNLYVLFFNLWDRPAERYDLSISLEMALALMPLAGVLLLMALTQTAFADETRLRTLKNSLSSGGSRRIVYGGKLLSGLLLAALCLGTSLAAFLATGLLLLPERDWSAFWEAARGFAAVLCCCIPLWLGMLGVFSLLNFSLSNGTAGAAAAVLLSFFAVPVLFSFQGPAAETVRKFYLPALLFDILPDGSYEGTERLMGQCWLTGCGYFAAAAALGWALFRRRDID